MLSLNIKSLFHDFVFELAPEREGLEAVAISLVEFALELHPVEAEGVQEAFH